MSDDRDTPDEYPFDLHDLVQILGTKAQGRIASSTISKYHEARYVVEYVDATGNPQTGEWFHEQLTLIEPADEAGAKVDEEELPNNVVALRRVH